MISAPALVLFSPGSTNTLSDLYEWHWASERTPGTRNCDREAMRLWERINPATRADQLTWEHSRKFRRELDDLVKTGTISANQANKLGRHINRFLRLLGPNDGSIDPEDPKALQPVGILPAPLRIKVPPKEDRDVDGWIDIDESGLFLGAARHARWVNPATGRPLGVVKGTSRPPSLEASQWWAAAQKWVYNTALRIEEAMEVLHSDVKADKHGQWLHVRADVSKTGQKREVYLNQHALAALAQFQRCGHEKIMAWEYSHSFLDSCRRAIFREAGLDRLLELGVGWHGWRKACATALVALSANQKDAGMEIAAKHLGHKPKSVTGGHYIHRSAVIPYVDLLPQPVAIECDRQLRLFD